VSATEIYTVPLFRRADIVTVPPSGVNFTAFSSR
jgi:hypothetical protein